MKNPPWSRKIENGGKHARSKPKTFRTALVSICPEVNKANNKLSERLVLGRPRVTKNSLLLAARPERSSLRALSTQVQRVLFVQTGNLAAGLGRSTSSQETFRTDKDTRLLSFPVTGAMSTAAPY